ncbi:two-component sensor histidine kinase [Actinomadura darangshiensis]|uniref:Two-component sensor histidine kinase n=1 Tax=Actinomadura darangshiensis TaxID=705336 RepID=A0A4R5B8R8_9ACTN|nr:two-component sensor histidine kinase [Actinomadura darangshiensis]
MQAGVAAVLAALALALHLVWVVPRTRRWRGGWVVLAQGLLAYSGVLAFGTSVGLLGVVAGSALLAGGAPIAMPVVVSAAAIEALRGGATADVTITCLLTGLVVYGLVRLADRVDDAAAARLPLTMAAAARERLRIAAELNRGLGDGLAVILRGGRRALRHPEEIGEVLDVARTSLNNARAAAVDLRSMSLAPEASAARALLDAAGVEVEVRTGHSEPLGPAGALLATVLREAVTDVVRVDSAKSCLIETSEDAGVVRLRVVNDGVRTAVQGEEGLARAAERVRQAGGTFTTGLGDDGRFLVEATADAGERAVGLPGQAAYRLSVTLLAAVLAGFSVKGLLLIPWGPLWPLALGGFVLASVLQLLWASKGWPKGWWLLLAVLSFAPVPLFGKAWLGLAGFLAGTLLVALPRRAAVPLVAATMAGVGAGAHLLGLGPAALVNYVISTLVTGLVVYGLVMLARLVRDLRAAGEELARAAAVQERLRAARDLHDLLGHSLAAILLKCELARRLAAVDAGRARAEIADVAAMAEQAAADLRAATGGEAELSLDGELRSAQSVLTAAGVDVETDARHTALDGPVSAVLSTVLREAVTNVLRHSAATRCVIVTEQDGDTVRLRVENDGRDPRAPRTAPGAGIGNLTTRLAALGGTLTASPSENHYRLEARIPR